MQIFQMLDMINVPDPKCVRLRDLKKGKMTSNFFNAFVNVHKYYEQEVTEGSERAAIEVGILIKAVFACLF